MSSIGHAPAALSIDQRELLALEDAVLLAIRRRDPVGLAALLTDDFVLVGSGGAETAREAFVRGATDVPGEIVELSVEHLRARIVAGVGVLTGLQRARVRLPSGVEVEDLQLFTDLCVRTEAGWRLALAHSGEAVPPA